MIDARQCIITRNGERCWKDFKDDENLLTVIKITITAVIYYHLCLKNSNWFSRFFSPSNFPPICGICWDVKVINENVFPELYSSHTSISFPSSNNSTSEMENNEVDVEGSLKKDRKDKSKFKSSSYKCQFCEKSFPRLGYLKKHEQVSELFKVLGNFLNVINARTVTSQLPTYKVTSINLLLFSFIMTHGWWKRKFLLPTNKNIEAQVISAATSHHHSHHYFILTSRMIALNILKIINETASADGILSGANFMTFSTSAECFIKNKLFTNVSPCFFPSTTRVMKTTCRLNVPFACACSSISVRETVIWSYTPATDGTNVFTASRHFPGGKIRFS